MFLLGALNLFVATTMSFQAWAWFITFGAVGAKVVAFLAPVLGLPVDDPPQAAVRAQSASLAYGSNP